MCDKIKTTIENKSRGVSEGNPEVNKNTDLGPSESKRQKLDGAVDHLDDQFLRDASVTLSDLESLFVMDKNGAKNVFCDQGMRAVIAKKTLHLDACFIMCNVIWLKNLI